MTGAAAHLGNERLDILAANPLGRALYADMFDGQERPNAARYVFLDLRARDFYADWERTARDVVATLRSAAGRHPDDRDLTTLIGELSAAALPASPTKRRRLIRVFVIARPYTLARAWCSEP